jgi:hypothetical protein
MRAHVADDELVRSLDGELPSGRQARVANHLASCSVCQRRAEQFRNTMTALTAAPFIDDELPQPSEFARLRLEHALRAAAAPPAPWWGLPAALERRALGTIGVGVLAVCLGGVGLLAVRAAHSAAVPEQAWSALPNASLTPGAVSQLTSAELCNGVRPSRLVSESARREVLHTYGMDGASAPAYELDALITPELGGSTDVANLWPQRYQSPVWNARVKDELERLLPSLVCSGAMTLAEAQREIASDWIRSYKRHFNTETPLRAHLTPVRDEEDELVFASSDAEVVGGEADAGERVVERHHGAVLSGGAGGHHQRDQMLLARMGGASSGS